MPGAAVPGCTDNSRKLVVGGKYTHASCPVCAPSRLFSTMTRHQSTCAVHTLHKVSPARAGSGCGLCSQSHSAPPTPMTGYRQCERKRDALYSLFHWHVDFLDTWSSVIDVFHSTTLLLLAMYCMPDIWHDGATMNKAVLWAFCKAPARKHTTPQHRMTPQHT